MTAVQILYTVQGASAEGAELDLIEFDAAIRIVHTSSAIVSKYPIERSATLDQSLADHIVVEGDRISLEAVVTNTPIAPIGNTGGEMRATVFDVESNYLQKPAQGGELGEIGQRTTGFAAHVLQFDAPFDRVLDVYNALLAIRGQAVTLITPLRQYDNVAIVDVQAPQDVRDAITFSIQFEVLRTGSTESVEAPDPVEPRGRPRVPQGAQSTTEATAATQQEGTASLARNLIDRYAPTFTGYR